jgi:hypothetical protein
MKLFFNIFFGIAGLVIIAGILIPSVPCGRPKEVAVTLSNFNDIAIACCIFRNEYGEIPRASREFSLFTVLKIENSRRLQFISLEKKIVDSAGNFLDGWGRPFIIRYLAQDIEITSLGADGVVSKDDLTELVFREPIKKPD